MQEHDSTIGTLTGQQIVYAANDWRTDNRTSSHHIASRLSKSNTILYLEAAGQRSPRMSGRDFRRILMRVQKAFRKPHKVQHNIFVLSPLTLPFHRWAWTRRINRELLKISVRRACRNLGFDRPIIWMAIPHYAAIMDAVPAKGIVYYCTDDYASFPNTDAAAIEMMENQILERSDVVFAVSTPLVESKSRSNPHTILSPHGVDVLHFRKAMSDETRVPQDIAQVQRPIAGFFGLVEEWFDLDLLDHCASRLPDVSFVVIGRLARDVGEVARRPNVHFMGPRPYDTLPNYLKAFSVALIPFKDNATIRSSNPLKFREYLAGGKPVVSIRIDAFANYESLSYLVDSYDGFTNAIRRAIDNDTQAGTEARSSAMLNESWDAKTLFIISEVRRHITL